MSTFGDEVFDSLVDAGRAGENDDDVKCVLVGREESDTGRPFVLIAVVTLDRPDGARVISQFIDEDGGSLDDAPGIGLALWEAARYDAGYELRRADIQFVGEVSTDLAARWRNDVPLNDQWGGLQIIFDRPEASS